ncbi:MAG TPA: DUF4157 domain-containing protein [Pyrinomonadaceae bacterium]|nr:DUF4157 domain-containing protein [Pyrinomonadaceae bacterium]
MSNLQRSIGNQAVRRLIHSPYIQAKLQISTPEDPQEQEADRVADTVMRRKEDDDEQVQLKAAQTAEPKVTTSRAANIYAMNGGGSPLPETTRAFFESRFGADFSHVRVHTDANAEENARSINAKAFTVGRNIAFGAGQYAPESNEGKRLLAHELVHTIQQQANTTIQREKKSDQHNWTKVTRIIVVAKTTGEGRGRAETADGQTFTIDIEANSLSAGRFTMPTKLVGESESDSWTRIHFDSRDAKTFVYVLPPNVTLAPSVTFVVMPKPRTVSEVWKEIQALPPYIQEFVIGKYGRTASVADYERALRIGKKLQAANVSADEVFQYNKLKGLKSSEKDVDTLLSTRSRHQAEREQNIVERGKAEAGLLGREALYRRYRVVKADIENAKMAALAHGAAKMKTTAEERAELEADLVKAGFPRGMADFEKEIKAYEHAFEHEALEMTLDLLGKYEHMLHRDFAKFAGGKTDEAARMHANLGKVKERAQEQYAKAKRARSLLKTLEYEIDRMSEGKKYQAKAEADQLRREANWRERLADKLVMEAVPEHTVVGWQNFKREELLSRATPEAVRYLMVWSIAEHEAAIQRAKKMLIAKPSHIYELDNLLEAAYDAQDIEKGSLPDLIIRDRISEIKSDKSAKEILLAIITIALSVVSFGGGAVGLLAAGAAFGIGAAQAVSAIEEYDTSTTFYLAQLLKEEPSAAWAIVAVLGAGLDAAGVVQAMKAVVPAAKAFTASGDLVKLSQDLAQVDAVVSENVMKAAKQVRAAEQQFKFAADKFKKMFTGAGGPAYTVVPHAVPIMAAIKATQAGSRLVAMTYYYVKTRMLKSFSKFIKQLEQDGIRWASLSTEQKAAIEKAFKEALEQGSKGKLPYAKQVVERLSERSRQAFTEESIDRYVALEKSLGKSDEEIIQALEAELQTQQRMGAKINPTVERPLPEGKVEIHSTGQVGDPLTGRRPGLERKYPAPSKVGLPDHVRFHVEGIHAIGDELNVVYAPSRFNISETALIENQISTWRKEIMVTGGELHFDFKVIARVVGEVDGVTIRVLESITWKLERRLPGTDDFKTIFEHTGRP